MRKFNISNAERRDAEVAFEAKSTRIKTTYKTADGSATHSEKRLRSTMETEPQALLEHYADSLHEAIVAEDPEIDLEKVGLRLEGLKKVYLTDEGKVAYGVTLTEQVFNPDGTEKEVRPEASTTGNIAVDGMPVRWTGKMMPKSDAIRRFVFKKSYQLRHVNGLTFDFLQAMAKKLADAKSMMLVGAGAKGISPLVMQTGGTPYRAFLEGRTRGDSYALILRLTNLELKSL
ncbi:MAG: hypothetical protein IKH93_00790 [Bacteroidales bacterium]|nr:hypothetical protein [Bacteroidales bacterium]